MMKFLAIFLILPLFLNLLPSRTWSAADITTVTNQVTQLDTERQAAQDQVDSLNAQIKFLQDQISSNNTEIDKNKVEIAEIQKQLTTEQTKLGSNLEELYEQNQTSFFEKLIKSQNLSDFMDQNEYLSVIKNKITKSVNLIQTQKQKLEQNKKDLSELQVQNALANASLQQNLAASQNHLNDLTAQEQKIMTDFSSMLAKQAISSYCKDQGKPVIKAKYPVFSFPTDCGYISQGYGNTEFARVEKAYNGAIHNGMDVGVNVGTPIKSIGKGTVYAKGASPSGGWGNWIMVKQDPVKIEGHDIQFYALYGHMVIESALNVGDSVDSGTFLGFSGGTPYWAPHLHLSLFASDSGWSDGNVGPYPGNTVDPLDYMNIPISTNGTDWDPAYAHS